MLKVEQVSALKSLGLKPAQIKQVEALDMDWAKILEIIMALLKLFAKK